MGINIKTIILIFIDSAEARKSFNHSLLLVGWPAPSVWYFYTKCKPIFATSCPQGLNNVDSVPWQTKGKIPWKLILLGFISILGEWIMLEHGLDQLFFIFYWGSKTLKWHIRSRIFSIVLLLFIDRSDLNIIWWSF